MSFANNTHTVRELGLADGRIPINEVHVVNTAEEALEARQKYPGEHVVCLQCPTKREYNTLFVHNAKGQATRGIPCSYAEWDEAKKKNELRASKGEEVWSTDPKAARFICPPLRVSNAMLKGNLARRVPTTEMEELSSPNYFARLRADELKKIKTASYFVALDSGPWCEAQVVPGQAMSKNYALMSAVNAGLEKWVIAFTCAAGSDVSKGGFAATEMTDPFFKAANALVQSAASPGMRNRWASLKRNVSEEEAKSMEADATQACDRLAAEFNGATEFTAASFSLIPPFVIVHAAHAVLTGGKSQCIEMSEKEGDDRSTGPTTVVRAKLFKGKGAPDAIAEARGLKANRFTRVKAVDPRFDEFTLFVAEKIDMRPWPQPLFFRLSREGDYSVQKPVTEPAQTGDVVCVEYEIAVTYQGAVYSNAELRSAIRVYPSTKLAEKYRLAAFGGAMAVRVTQVSKAVAESLDFDDDDTPPAKAPGAEPGSDATPGKRAAPETTAESSDGFDHEQEARQKRAAFEERGAAARAAAATDYYGDGDD